MFLERAMLAGREVPVYNLRFESPSPEDGRFYLMSC